MNYSNSTSTQAYDPSHDHRGIKTKGEKILLSFTRLVFFLGLTKLICLIFSKIMNSRCFRVFTLQLISNIFHPSGNFRSPTNMRWTSNIFYPCNFKSSMLEIFKLAVWIENMSELVRSLQLQTIIGRVL